MSWYKTNNNNNKGLKLLVLIPIILAVVVAIVMAVFLVNIDSNYHEEIHVAKTPIISANGGNCVVETTDRVQRTVFDCGYLKGDMITIEYYLSDNIYRPKAFIITEKFYKERIERGYSTP